MKIENLKITEIKPYDKNARKHPKAQIELLKKNIERFGFTTPCLIDTDNELIAGHGRLEAVKELGWIEVPCVRMENLTKDEVKALRIADNKLAEMAEWDMDLVLEELKGLNEVEKELTGFGDIDLEEDEIYTSKIEPPVYEPSEKQPEINELLNIDKCTSLLNEIESSDIPKEQKDFLKYAAYRHIVFDYSKIADFYAHSSKEVQELMEKSALVIIDLEQAIENGFAELSKKMEDQYLKEYEK